MIADEASRRDSSICARTREHREPLGNHPADDEIPRRPRLFIRERQSSPFPALPHTPFTLPFLARCDGFVFFFFFNDDASRDFILGSESFDTSSRGGGGRGEEKGKRVRVLRRVPHPSCRGRNVERRREERNHSASGIWNSIVSPSRFRSAHSRCACGRVAAFRSVAPRLSPLRFFTLGAARKRSRLTRTRSALSSNLCRRGARARARRLHR